MRKPGYFVYGEGSIHHNGHPCEHGLDEDEHPLIQRTQYPSYREYLYHEFWMWMLDHIYYLGYLKPFQPYVHWAPRDEFKHPPRLWNMVVKRALKQYPTVWAPLRKSETVYREFMRIGDEDQ